jgi:hypothetical protein
MVIDKLRAVVAQIQQERSENQQRREKAEALRASRQGDTAFREAMQQEDERPSLANY